MNGTPPTTLKSEAVKMEVTDQRPKRSHVHMIFSCHFIPNSRWSKEWIVVGPSHVKLPIKCYSHELPSIINSVNHDIVDWKGVVGMWSLTLCPSGEERSRIRRQFPGWLLFETIPKHLFTNLLKVVRRKDLRPDHMKLHSQGKHRWWMVDQRLSTC